MHMTVLRRIEAGEREPRLVEAMKIAETLGIPVELLTLDATSNKHLAAVSDSLVAFQERSNKLQKHTNRPKPSLAPPSAKPGAPGYQNGCFSKLRS